MLIPIFVKLPLLLGVFASDPRIDWADLAPDRRPGFLWGQATLDPNIAATSHALGRRAALELFSGRLPWWNPFEGIGMPLAGEMQSAALFPLTWLMILPQGQLYEHLILQIIAGLGAFALMRRLDVSRASALAASIVFQFHGMFAWQANAVINPVPFLPWLLLGVELVRCAPERSWRGVALVALAVALSLYAGFPETAFFSALLAGVWTLARWGDVPRADRVRYVARVAAAGVAGVLLAAPVLIAFVGFLPHAELGAHAGAGFAGLAIPARYLVGLFFPYAFGAISVNADARTFWTTAGSYTGIVLVVLAVAGVGSSRPRSVRMVAAVWAGAALAATYGLPLWTAAVTSLPPFDRMATYRYVPGTIAICLCLLAAFALDELRSGQGRRALGRAFAATALLVAAAWTYAALAGAPLLAGAVGKLSVVAGLVLPAAAFAVATLGRLRGERRAALLGLLLAGEAVALFALPILSSARGGDLREGGIAFLRDHLGLRRFATLGPIAPNYGSFYGVASVNYNDLPGHRAWVDHVKSALDPNSDRIAFNGWLREDARGETGRAAFLAHQTAFAAAGVAYVVAYATKPLPGLVEVYRDDLMRIYALPGAAPYFSAPGCAIAAARREAATATCSRASALTRLEANLPGWTARVNGLALPIAAGGLFQTVALPAGRSTIGFSYRPPHIAWSIPAMLLGLALVGAAGYRPARGVRPRPAEAP